MGVLGVFPLAQLGKVHAYKVAHATQRIIEEFAAPTRTMPYTTRGRFLGLFNSKRQISKKKTGVNDHSSKHKLGPNLFQA